MLVNGATQQFCSRLPAAEGRKSLLHEIALRFSRWIVRSHDKESSVVARYRYALRSLHHLFGSSLAHEFSPRKLVTVREEMIRRGLGLTTVNGYISAIKGMFAWAVQEEFVPPAIDWGLRAVKGLRRGQRTDLKDPKKVRPVPESDLKATLKELTPTVRTMVRLQLATGMRPGELIQMMIADIDRKGQVWRLPTAATQDCAVWRGPGGFPGSGRPGACEAIPATRH